MAAMEKQCTVLLSPAKLPIGPAAELRDRLEKGSTPDKRAAMKTTIRAMINGDPLDGFLMTVIRFVLPDEDHSLKKLALIFLEIVDKTDGSGALKPEFILVCNQILNDLNHPNEWIRGCTLRFCTKIQETELLEPWVGAMVQNLEHRHSFVRRNAVMAIYTTYRTSQDLLPNAPQTIENFLRSEPELGPKRNAFLMLFNCDQERAVAYLQEVMSEVSDFGDLLQMLVLELIKKVCQTNPLEKSRYVKVIFNFLGSQSGAVMYEASCTLVALSNSPTAIRAATTTFCKLLATQSDNNVKLIVLDRLVALKVSSRDVLQEMLMDIMKTLASPNFEIRRKVLDIVMDLVSNKNIEEVVSVLKKEVMKTQTEDYDKNVEYRQLLIQSIHECAVKFPEVAGTVVHLLMDFLGDSTGQSAVDVVFFLREIVEAFPALQVGVVQKLMGSFPSIKSSRVFRCALWILGEYCTSAEDIAYGLAAIQDCVGKLPLIPQTAAADGDETVEDEAPVYATKNVILADGTYGTQTSVMEKFSASADEGESNLRALLLAGDFFLGSVVCTALTKLVLRGADGAAAQDSAAANGRVAQSMLTCCAIVRLGRSPEMPHLTIDEDSYERIVCCLRVLCEDDAAARKLFTDHCRESFRLLLRDEEEKREAALKVESAKTKQKIKVDEQIAFRQLKSRLAIAGDEMSGADDLATDLERATGSNENQDDFSERLSKIVQLTGFSDKVYAEAYVAVHQYDIVLDVLVLNQTQDTLQNLSIELATMGDLKLTERPQNHTLGPYGSRHIKANIKVSSTETGVIFGNVVFDVAGPSAADSLDRTCVILNDIHIDIMDYITPGQCDDVSFRTMWAEFEWENKVAVNTSIEDPQTFLEHIIKSTNMACLAPKSSLRGDSSILAANLYAKSIFGEDALANLSVEKQPDGKLAGYIRIRSKTQGIALSLGDKITLQQRSAAAAAAQAGVGGVETDN